MDTFQNRFRVFSYSDKDLKIFIQKLQNAKYLHGYSSMIYEIARIINKNRIETSSLNLKMIKGTSEKIHQHYHNEVIQAFGQKIISEYGAAEAGIVAFECPFGSMHLNMEGCIVEDDNGEILVTNLNSYSFPIIRYRLGDSIQLEDEKFKCKCGMEHRVLREITGRVGKRIFGKSITYPSLTVYNIFKNLYLDAGLAINGQFVQKTKGHLLVKVEQALTSEEKALINQEMNSYFKHDMDWQIEENSKIHTRDSKRTDFLSYIE
ncbi:hypothetical protein OAL42_00125 [Akkermansiaceae bacterium]|nr:hypothetical protein [Akkermansiaceae bacterium]